MNSTKKQALGPQSMKKPQFYQDHGRKSGNWNKGGKIEPTEMINGTLL